MNLWGPTIVIYLVAGAGVAGALFLSDLARTPLERGFQMTTAVLFWPLYLPVLLDRAGPKHEQAAVAGPSRKDDMAAVIAQVDAELETALTSLTGWADAVLTREQVRLHELHALWSTQAERIRAMDRLLAQAEHVEVPAAAGPELAAGNERLRTSQRARAQNLERLRKVRDRAYNNLMATLAWVRELVSMIHLARFTGAPAARAEELVGQIAAAVEGLADQTWQEGLVNGETALTTADHLARGRR